MFEKPVLRLVVQLTPSDGSPPLTPKTAWENFGTNECIIKKR